MYCKLPKTVIDSRKVIRCVVVEVKYNWSLSIDKQATSLLTIEFYSGLTECHCLQL